MPGDDPTHERIRAIAAELAKELAEEEPLIVRLLEIKAKQRALLMAELKQLMGGDERLQFISGDGTNVPTPMEAQNTVPPSRAAKISATKSARRKRDLPFQKALQLAGKSVKEWADEQKDPPLDDERARSWMKKPGRSGRAIPRAWADRIAKEFPSVPAIDESWPNGIKD